MTIAFWLLSAVLVAGVVGLLWFAMRGGSADPLAARRRALHEAHASGVIDDEEFARKSAGLDAQSGGASVVASPPRGRAGAIALAIALPLLAFAVYRVVGMPQAITPLRVDATNAAASAAVAHAGGADAAQAPEMEKAISELAERLAKSPEDLDGWLLLARAYKATQQYPQSFDAMQRALALSPDSPEVQLEHAESEALGAPDRRFTESGRAVLTRALVANPANQRALWLSGIDAVQREAYADAVRHWQALDAQLDPASDIAKSVREQIARAREVGKLDGEAATAQIVQTESAPATGAAVEAPAVSAPGANAVTVSVDISPALRERLGVNDTLFVFARAATGPKMPLAIQKRSASMLPLTLTLDDSMGMMPALKLSSADTLVFSARVSARGDATPATGDLQTISAPIARQSINAPIRLVIDEVVP